MFAFCPLLWRCLEEQLKIEKTIVNKDMSTQQGLPDQVPDAVPVVPVVPVVDPPGLPPVPDSPSGTAQVRSDYSRQRGSAAAVDSSMPAAATQDKSKQDKARSRRRGASADDKKVRSRSPYEEKPTRSDRVTAQEAFQSLGSSQPHGGLLRA